LTTTILEIVFVLVILKIPVAYVGWVIWWAIKAEPEVGAEGGTEGVNWSPWRRSPSDSPARPRRGGPHGAPARGASRAPRRHERAGGASA
jgi:hypothetical protein